MRRRRGDHVCTEVAAFGCMRARVPTLTLTALLLQVPLHGASAQELVLALEDAAAVPDQGSLELAVDLGFRCAASIAEQGNPAAMDQPRYLVSRDNGAAWEFWSGAGWRTGAHLEQAMDAASLSAVLRSFVPLRGFLIRIAVLPGESVPPLEAVVLQPCACGDGVSDWGESCDDGATVSGDGCSSTCTLEPGYTCRGAPSVCGAVCGNGVINIGEDCDDGGIEGGDGCSPFCRVEIGYACSGVPSSCAPLCGDGSLDPGEECDDGNTVSNDGCSAACRREGGYVCIGVPSMCAVRCGNGVLDAGEECDDGNTAANDGCGPACLTEPEWTCTGVSSICRRQCGNGSIDIGEACDDGNRRPGDGCSPSCALEVGFACVGEPSLCAAACGNGRPDFGEQCDDGGVRGGDGCSAVCTVERGASCSGEPSSCRAQCGDRVRATFEGCDDGNQLAGDGCSERCVVELGFVCVGEPSVCAATCGNGVLDAGEGCDDGNVAARDGCSPVCQRESGFRCLGEPSDCVTICGDGGRAGDEQCDDGSYMPGDGCSSTCELEAGWECLALSPTVCVPACGDGNVIGGEECDDGNRLAGDGCSPTCTFESGECTDETCGSGGSGSSRSYLRGTAMGGAGACSALWLPPRLGAVLALWVLARRLRLRRRRRLAVRIGRGPLLGLLFVLAASGASAQGMELQRHQPALGSDDLASLRLVGQRTEHLTVSAISIYTQDPLRIAGDGAEHPVVDGRIDLVLGVAVPIADLFEVSASVPIVAYQSERAVWDGEGFIAGRRRRTGLGTPRLGAVVPLATFEPWNCTFAATPQVGVALAADTLDSAAFAMRPAAAASCSYDRFLGSVELGVLAATLGSRAGSDPGLEVSWAAGAGIALDARASRDLLLSLETNGAFLANRPFAHEAEVPVEALAAGLYRWREGAALLAGFGLGLVPGYGAPAWRAFVGVRWDLGTSTALPAAPDPPSGLVSIDPPADPAPIEADAPAALLASTGDDVQQEDEAALGDADEMAVGATPEEELASLGRRVFFAIGSNTLKRRARAALDRMAEVLAARPDLHIVIEGHADGSGTFRGNLVLSARRAKIVRDYLVSRGIAAERIEVVSRGEGAPRAVELSGRGSALNRRVQIRTTAE